MAESTFCEDSMTQEELDSLTQRLREILEQKEREQAAFEKGLAIGRRLAECQELPY